MSGFYLEILKNNIPASYRLFCVESDYAKGVSTNADSMNLNYGVGGSLRLSTSPTGTEGNYYYFDLLGNKLSWNVDLSNVPCGLNATFYSVYLHNGDKYKDACATWTSTTELDFMEANQYCWHSTFHRASGDCGGAPPIGYGGTISDPRYLFKDLSGVQKDVKLLYGPGTQYVINTAEVFSASVQFNSTSQELTSIEVVLEQDGNQIGQTLDSTNEQYKGWLAALGKEMMNTATSGNVFVWSVWTGGLNWLESPPCGYNSFAKCNATSCQYTVSETNITSL